MRSRRAAPPAAPTPIPPANVECESDTALTEADPLVIRSGIVAWSLDPNTPDDPTVRRVITFFGFAERDLTAEHYEYARGKLTDDPTRYIAMHFDLVPASREMMEYYVEELDVLGGLAVVGPVEH